jgi:hypothetical protein
MPTNRTRRRSPRRASSKLDAAQRSYLEYGIHMSQFDREDDVRQAWRQHRASILTDWIREHPGTRPYFWWEVERPSGQLRRQIAGPKPLIDSPIHRGYPTHWPSKGLIFEPEVQFLRRNNLLTREEVHQYATLLEEAREEIREEVRSHNVQASHAGSLHLPCALFTDAELDEIFRKDDES